MAARPRQTFFEFVYKLYQEHNKTVAKVLGVPAAITGAHKGLSSWSPAYAKIIENPAGHPNDVLVLVLMLLLTGTSTYAVLWYWYTSSRASKPLLVDRLAVVARDTAADCKPDLKLAVTIGQGVRGIKSLAPQPRAVRPGDTLIFELTPTGPKAAWLYLLHVNEKTGNLKVIFPNVNDSANAVGPEAQNTIKVKNACTHS